MATAARTPHLSLRLQRLIPPALFIAPAALALILTMAAPMAAAILLSLQHWNGMAPPQLGRLQQLPASVAGPDVPEGALAHRIFHGVHRDPADRSAAADREPAQFRHPWKHGVPDALLHAGHHFAGDQRPALGDAVRAQFRRRSTASCGRSDWARSPSCGSPTPTRSCRASSSSRCGSRSASISSSSSPRCRASPTSSTRRPSWTAPMHGRASCTSPFRPSGRSS